VSGFGEETIKSCVTCGDPLHPERAERYDYCIRPECQERNAKGLEIVAVGVNKAADQYIALSERNRRELESGRYKKVPGVPGTARRTSRQRRKASPRPARVSEVPSLRVRSQWTKAHEDLALIYRDRGMKPDEIAAKLGMSRYLVTQILLAATRRPKR
jgi:hypothetical protein